jgi:hypothetical protein
MTIAQEHRCSITGLKGRARVPAVNGVFEMGVGDTAREKSRAIPIARSTNGTIVRLWCQKK